MAVHVSPRLQEFRCLIRCFEKTAGTLAQSRDDEISQRMPAQSVPPTQPVLEQTAERAIAIGQRDEAIAQIADCGNSE